MWASPKSESKTASQLASLTMRLKDKLHAQKIKHQQRSKPPDLNLQEHTLQHKGTVQPGYVLLDHQRAVVSSLQYFKAVVDRLGVDKPGGNKQVLDQTVVGNLLGGTSTDVLEAVQTLVRLEPHLKDSKTISTCLTSLYQSLAQLIGWADQVLLQGISLNEDEKSTAGVTTVIRAVLDKVKDLVRFAGERLDGCVPLSPVLSEPDVDWARDADDQEAWSGSSPTKELTSPPPKPQMPVFQYPVCPGPGPPALPPKKRPSSAKPPCRVAIVAPMRREPEVDTKTQECEDDDLLKQLSSCRDSSVKHCDSEVIEETDPDYQFLLTDLSSCDALPSVLLPSTSPPALPEKKRSITLDTINFQTVDSFLSDLTTQDLTERTDADDTVTAPLSPVKTPPPLPEKKRHIHQYLQFCLSYSLESTAKFYHTPQTLSLSPKDHLTQTHLLPDPDPGPDLDPDPDPDFPSSPGSPFAPALPPKKKQQDPQDPPTDLKQEVGGSRLKEESCDQQIKEDQEHDLLMTDHQEIFNRITMKTNEEEGPDVKAASSEVLLVYATETDSTTEMDLYCEAFLATFRTFISPLEVISKLQHRYRHVCSGREDKDINAAKNTFHLLVRVVDELSVMELEADLLQLLTDMVFKHLTDGELALAHLLRSTVLSKLELKWQSCSTLSTCPLAARGVTARPRTLLDFRSQDLAEQLTLMDSQLFFKIERPEVLMWSKEQNEEKSPNLTEFTQHFNNVSFWVRSVIILQEKPQDREKLMLKFLKIMKHLRKLNNFNSYLAILSALDSAPLRRLDWQRSTAEALEELSSLIDSSSSFRAYRAALAEVEPPCIPYLGLILQDLTFVHLGNPDSLGTKVNFSKRWQQFNILYTLKSYQQVPYCLQPNNDIILFFNGFSDHLAEEALWELSLRLKPRNNQRNVQR